ncbi:quinon protein alcohol dehydrogenase-like superfamily [Trametes gibbosa]|nr:quinon protein alcohol dehydrogenase-like superfamily [Trametes gibbosa]
MGGQVPWCDRLDCLLARFEAFKSTAFHEPDRKLKTSRFQRILSDVCAVVRDAEHTHAPQLGEVIEQAHALLEACLKYAHSDQAGLQALNTFGHSDDFDEPWIDDVMENAGSDIIDEFIRLYSKNMKPGSLAPQLPNLAHVRPWTRSPRPHGLTTRLSRFRPGIVPTATSETPLARCVAEARAQLTTDLVPTTYDMSISSGSSILAIASGAGWKAREPTLQYYLLNAQSNNCLEGVSINTGQSSVPRFIATDEARKLVFVADDDNIKSFSFGSGDGGAVPKRLPNVHTMNSERIYDGPITTLSNGRIARAGKGQAAVWDISALSTSGDDSASSICEGTPRIGSHHDEAGRLFGMQPGGSKPHSIVPFADDPAYAPSTWHLHPSSGHLICGERAARSGGYACLALDLEHGGRRAARYLGHGGDVVRITTSPGDPNLFVTAASDGYARMFDVRRPLPVLTIETGIQREGCADVVFVHPDGIPTLFTGGDRTQQIKMWDIREQECVYELSTGNNAVSAMVWDDVRASLYVATTCPHVNHLGERAGYRRARIPTWATWAGVERDYKAYKMGNGAATKPSANPVGRGPIVVHDENGTLVSDEGEEERGYYDTESEDSGEDDEEIDEAYSADMRWPEKCFHKENYFGYAYDAGENMLFRWHFKDAPDIMQLPASTTNDW